MVRLYYDNESRLRLNIKDQNGDAYNISAAASVVWFLSVDDRLITQERSLSRTLGESDWSQGKIEIEFGKDFTPDELALLKCMSKMNVYLNIRINSPLGYGITARTLVDTERNPH